MTYYRVSSVTESTWIRTLATVLTLLMLISSSGCETEKQRLAREKAEAAQLIAEQTKEIDAVKENDNRKMLAPQWYKDSLSYVYLKSGYIFSISLIRLAITFLGLVSIGWIKTVEKEGETAGLASSLWNILLRIEIVAFILSIFLWVVVFIAMGDRYIPRGLIVSFLYVFTTIQLLTQYLSDGSLSNEHAKHVVFQGLAQSGHPSRKKLSMIALRALVVAVITSLGSQLGGWIGGIAAIVVSSVIATLIGGGGGSDPDHNLGQHT